MPLINNYKQVKEIYCRAAELGVGLPVFCAEDRETLEAILASAYEFGKEIGVDNLPIIPAWTSRYPPRGQMQLITACGNPLLGVELMFSDIEMFMGENSPYRNLTVMPHLDHAFPWLDGDILTNYADRFASVMCDASERPFEENIRITGEYVEKMHGRVVIEGAVDEIFESGNITGKNEPTSVEQVVRFLRETGVDIIVPNVGTEHRATADKIRYQSDRAREISTAVGKILCLHGTSSVKP
ncbi:MAG: class II fructose-bisphosphate aldolase, partial [Clostridiales bacterium]|nr:class II fructose-bisphosphate aldolase [Clostridiales bacterium]